ncbi:MAG TPA: sigma-54-dependent Fis family transcriptional regulator [Gammaproteobacteria bacterium]|nr:sigma-54-dependent Fis family transcriptional regulator [Gammaproteobacteria bacterium]
MTTPLALIVDDEPDICELLELTLSGMQIESRTAATLAEARALLKQHRFDLCLTDMRLPDGDGLELLRRIREQNPQLPVAVITAHGNMELAIEALKAGAFDFLSKPVDLRMLRKQISGALRVSPNVPRERRTRHVLLGESPVMRELRGAVEKVSRSQAPVFISGESGTGKELVARMIHSHGPRSDQPFVPVNCGAIPKELVESEFFGHRKGSFTGATSDKKGLFQAADGGTLFLDEVADLSLDMQVKLLRAIQEKRIRPVGDARELPVDVRILSATHKDLAALVKQGAFRQDLYYRINVIEIPVPALRERLEDIPQLVEHIMLRLEKQNGTAAPTLTPEALQRLQNHDFPGNVRELENILERAFALCEEGIVTPGDLGIIQRRQPAAEFSPLPDNDIPLEEYLATIEKEAIQAALQQTGYNKTAAAKLLGMSFRSLRYRLKKLGME